MNLVIYLSGLVTEPYISLQIYYIQQYYFQECPSPPITSTIQANSHSVVLETAQAHVIFSLLCPLISLSSPNALHIRLAQHILQQGFLIFLCHSEAHRSLGIPSQNNVFKSENEIQRKPSILKYSCEIFFKVC